MFVGSPREEFGGRKLRGHRHRYLIEKHTRPREDSHFILTR